MSCGEDTQRLASGSVPAIHNQRLLSIPPQDALRVVTGDFRTSLPDTLSQLEPSRVAVVACHACSHLTDEVLHACAEAGVAFAVMPCCHRDTARDVDKGQIAHAGDSLGIGVGAAMDLVRMGRMQV